MTDPIATTLPRGYCTNGRASREAHVRPLTGEDYLFLTDECRGLLPAQWATEALARCVTSLAPDEAVTREAIRALTVGDREALLLHLRRLTWGERLRCLLTCPEPDCQEQMEFDANVADLLLPPYDETADEHDLTLTHDDGCTIVVRFRLPTGADQEAAAVVARADVAAAADLLLQRCLRSAAASDGRPADRLPGPLAERLADRMAALDPQAEITMQLACPVCSAPFSVIFDTASYVMQELEAGMSHLYREVHLLAYHYHWSAAEIISMSTAQRKQFLQLLEEELTQGAAQ